MISNKKKYIIFHNFFKNKKYFNLFIFKLWNNNDNILFINKLKLKILKKRIKNNKKIIINTFWKKILQDFSLIFFLLLINDKGLSNLIKLIKKDINNFLEFKKYFLKIVHNRIILDFLKWINNKEKIDSKIKNNTNLIKNFLWKDFFYNFYIKKIILISKEKNLENLIKFSKNKKDFEKLYNNRNIRYLLTFWEENNFKKLLDFSENIENLIFLSTKWYILSLVKKWENKDFEKKIFDNSKNISDIFWKEIIKNKNIKLLVISSQIENLKNTLCFTNSKEDLIYLAENELIISILKNWEENWLKYRMSVNLNLIIDTFWKEILENIYVKKNIILSRINIFSKILKKIDNKNDFIKFCKKDLLFFEKDLNDEQAKKYFEKININFYLKNKTINIENIFKYINNIWENVILKNITNPYISTKNISILSPFFCFLNKKDINLEEKYEWKTKKFFEKDLSYYQINNQKLKEEEQHFLNKIFSGFFNIVDIIKINNNYVSLDLNNEFYKKILNIKKRNLKKNILDFNLIVYQYFSLDFDHSIKTNINYKNELIFDFDLAKIFEEKEWNFSNEQIELKLTKEDIDIISKILLFWKKYITFISKKNLLEIEKWRKLFLYNEKSFWENLLFRAENLLMLNLKDVFIEDEKLVEYITEIDAIITN